MNPILSVLGLLGVILLTVGTAVFVAAEFSLTTLERGQVDAHVAKAGDARARQVQHAHRTLSFQLSGAQVGITITTIVTGFLAEPALEGLISPGLVAMGLPGAAVRPITYTLALFLATALSMIFGELVPKNLALARPLNTARMVAGAQSGFSTVFGWLIRGLNGSANWIVRGLGVEPAEELRSARSPRELGSLVRTSAQHGTIDAATARLLDRSLRLGERNAYELMTARVQLHALSGDSSVADLIELSRVTGLSRFPVYSGDLDSVHGVVHVKQAFGVPVPDRRTTPVSSLVKPVPTVPETLRGDLLLDRLRASGLQVAVVVDEYGGTAGMVTLEDVFEEIIGDVRDEHDRLEAAPVRSLGSNSWMVSGLLREDELAEATGFPMPDGEYETIAGLILFRLGHIPVVGEEVWVGDWWLTVMRMDRHRIADVRVARVAEQPAIPTSRSAEDRPEARL